ncbi:MAG: DUF6249 domain-containing protein [Bacteroidetes bacterium]|nr:DUF6249 domain-containing protein [Bacteroidota bacterium]
MDLITLIFLSLPFAFVIAITWLKVIEKHKRQQLQADLYAKALEKGQPVPTDLFEEKNKLHKPLHIGIILVASGIGITLFLWLLFSAMDSFGDSMYRSIAWVGILPFFVGIAFLLIHLIEKKKGANEEAQ